MQLDPAVLKVLSLDEATVDGHGGGGCSSASTSKIVSKTKNGKQEYFMKTGTGPEAEIMFKGEHASLNAVHNAVPSLCPKSYAYGRYASSPDTHFLVTDFLHLSARRSSSSTSGSQIQSLAEKLAKLHTTPAPTPEGYSQPMFGFPVTTCCGDTPQDNTFKESWADFYANNRLRFILKRAEARNGEDKDFNRLVETTASKVVPRLLGDDHLNNGKRVTPVVIHGDLWSGNASRGSIEAESETEDVVYDPSSCYAHNEFELGIMKMFGGFGGAFLREYHSICPKTEPVDEYEDRVTLYELYHHLNHYALFGGGYKSGASSIMQRLIKKYGHDQA